MENIPSAITFSLKKKKTKNKPMSSKKKTVRIPPFNARLACSSRLKDQLTNVHRPKKVTLDSFRFLKILYLNGNRVQGRVSFVSSVHPKRLLVKNKKKMNLDLFWSYL